MKEWYEAPSPDEIRDVFLTERELEHLNNKGYGKPFVWLKINHFMGKVRIDCDVKLIGEIAHFGIRNGKRYVDYGDANKIDPYSWQILERVWQQEFDEYYIKVKPSIANLIRKFW